MNSTPDLSLSLTHLVQALYGRTKGLLWTIWLLFIGESIIMTIMLSFTVRKIEVGDLCTIVRFPAVAAGFL
jgi:hypothetical protein